MKCILWLHVHGPLMNYSVHLLSSSVHFLLGWYVHIPSHVDVFSVITISSWRICTVMKFFPILFIYVLLVSLCLHEWYFMATWVPTSDDIFCGLTLSCWPILYMPKFLIAYFVHINPLNSIRTTSSWSDLYISDFYGQFYLLLLDRIFFTYFLASCAPTSGDLYCTHTSSWWPILYTRKFLKAYSLLSYVWFILYSSLFVHRWFLRPILFILFSLVS